MNIKSPLLFWIGIALALFLLISSIIKVEVESGLNYVTYSSLLGILIFYNPLVLIIYIILIVFIIYKGISKRIRLI